MRSAWALSFGLAALAACNGLTGADDLRSGAAGDPTNAITGGDARAPASPAPGDGGSEAPGGGDGGVSVPDSAPPPKPDAGVTAIDEGFDNASDCLAWTTIGPATRQANVDGHYGAGSCLLCATGPGDVFLEKTITTSKTAKYGVHAWGKRPAGKTTPPGFTTAFVSNVGMGSATAGLSTSAWSEGSGAKVSLSDNTVVTVRVGIEGAAAGDCVLVDDVMLIVN